MAIAHSRPTITTAAAALNLSGDRVAGVLYNNSGGTVYVGGSTVTTGTGLAIVDGAALDFALGEGERIYAIAGSSLVVQLILSGQ